MRGIAFPLIVLFTGVAGGLAVGLHLSRPDSGADRSAAPAVVRDIVDVPTMSVEDAESQRVSGFGDVQTIEDTLRFPTGFLRTESLYVLAGRSDSAALQDLIFQADRIADFGDRSNALIVLFRRLTELDPKSALAISGTVTFESSPEIEQTVWMTWARLDLDAALAAAGSVIDWHRRDRVAQTFYAAFGFAQDESTRRIERELGVSPNLSARRRFVRSLAERTPAEAIAFVNALDEDDVDRELVSSMAHAIGLRFQDRAMAYASQLDSAEYRKIFLEATDRALAELDPETVIQRSLGVSRTQTEENLFSIALTSLAARDLDSVVAHFAAAAREPDRHAIGSVIVRAIGRTDARSAIEWAAANDRGESRVLLRQALNEAAATDPQLALDFAATMDDQGLQRNLINNVLITVGNKDRALALRYIESIENPQVRNWTVGSLMRQWAQEAPDAAVEWVLTNESVESEQLMQTLGGHIARSDIEAAIRLLPRAEGQALRRWRFDITNALLKQRSVAEAQQFVSQFEGTLDYDQLQTAIIGSVSSADVDTAVRMIGELSSVSARDRAYQQLVMNRIMNDAADAASWVDQIENSQARRQTIEFLIRTWHGQDEAAAQRWIDEMPDGRDRDDSIITVAGFWTESTPSRDQLIESVTDPTKRAKARRVQIMAIARRDWSKAEVMLASSDLSAAEKDELRQYIDRFKSRTP